MSSDRKINKTSTISLSTSQSRCCDELTYTINFNNKLKPPKRFLRLFRLHLFATKENGSVVFFIEKFTEKLPPDIPPDILSKLTIFKFLSLFCKKP